MSEQRCTIFFTEYSFINLISIRFVFILGNENVVTTVKINNKCKKCGQMKFNFFPFSSVAFQRYKKCIRKCTLEVIFSVDFCMCFRVPSNRYVRNPTRIFYELEKKRNTNTSTWLFLIK